MSSHVGHCTLSALRLHSDLPPSPRRCRAPLDRACAYRWLQGAELLQAAELAGSGDEGGDSDDSSVSGLQLGSDGSSDAEDTGFDEEEAAAAPDVSGRESASEVEIGGEEDGSDAEGDA